MPENISVPKKSEACEKGKKRGTRGKLNFNKKTSRQRAKVTLKTLTISRQPAAAAEARKTNIKRFSSCLMPL